MDKIAQKQISLFAYSVGVV